LYGEPKSIPALIPECSETEYKKNFFYSIIVEVVEVGVLVAVAVLH